MGKQQHRDLRLTDPGSEFIEIELKCSIPQRCVEQLCQHPLLKKYSLTEPKTKQVFNIYYDTEDHRLRKMGYSFRVRDMDGEYFQTLKRRSKVIAGLHQRVESEVKIDKPEVDLSLIEDENLIKFFKDSGAIVKPLFTTKFTRKQWDLEIDSDTKIEFVLDRGKVLCEGESSSISEIELELKAGHIDSLYSLALELMETIDLKLESKSKAARGYELNDPSSAGVKSEHKIALERNETTQGIFKIIDSKIAELNAFKQQGLTAKRLKSKKLQIILTKLRMALDLFNTIYDDPELKEYSANLEEISKNINKLNNAAPDQVKLQVEYLKILFEFTEAV